MKKKLVSQNAGRRHKVIRIIGSALFGIGVLGLALIGMSGGSTGVLIDIALACVAILLIILGVQLIGGRNKWIEAVLDQLQYF